MSNPDDREGRVYNRGEDVAVWHATSADFIGPPIPEMAEKQSPHDADIIGLAAESIATGEHHLAFYKITDALDFVGLILSTLAREMTDEQDRVRAGYVYRELGRHFPQARQQDDEDLMSIPTSARPPDGGGWPRIVR
jgi:hypothetical protein